MSMSTEQLLKEFPQLKKVLASDGEGWTCYLTSPANETYTGKAKAMRDAARIALDEYLMIQEMARP